MRPVPNPAHEAVLYRIDVAVFDISFVIAVIADEVLPIAPLPDTAFASGRAHLDRHSSLGSDFEKCVLIIRQRVAKSASSGGKVQTA
jgi:hypothetical protein